MLDGAIDTARNVYSLVRPVRRVSASSMKVHGLRPVDLFDAPNPSQVAALLQDACRDATVVAHAAWMEDAMLDRLARGTRTRLARPAVDTAALARACGLADDVAHEPSLEQLARDLGLPVYSPHHALGDALTTAVVFLCLTTRLDRELFDGSMTDSDLVELTTGDARSRSLWS